MRLMILLSVVGVCHLATAALAQQTVDHALRMLDTGFDASGWEAVGRIDVGTRGFCTGALISPRLVLTAAHCLFDKTSGTRVADTEIVFRAGWRNGAAVAEGRVLNSAVHPAYIFSDHVRLDNVAADLALLELVHPITTRGVTPFDVLSQPPRGAPVAVVSYGRSRSEVPALQEQCNVLRRDQSGLLMLSCAVEFGSSGAPVFMLSEGRAQIVSVISAKSENLDTADEVSFGVGLGAQLDDLHAALEASNNRFVRPPDETALRPAAGTSVPRVMQSGSGARFLRP